MSEKTYESVWPGLSSYTEKEASLFFGRDAEIEKLYTLAVNSPLCTLYGPSGTGKSSLLQAGVFPRFREDGYLPVLIRLDHSPAAPAYSMQITKAFLDSAFQFNVDVKEVASSHVTDREETIWEWFHRHQFVDKFMNPVLPIIVIDQFEEVFTLADDNLKVDAWFGELSDFCSNEVPDSVLRTIEKNGKELGFAVDEQSWRVIISLREDFLSRLEERTEKYLIFRNNRISISAFDKNQARQAVLGPGAEIVNEDVALAIVELVGRSTTGKLGKVDPALLSLLCSQLDQRRCEQGLAKITKDLLTESGHSILYAFYANASSMVSAKTMRLIEEHLLTVNGFRASWAVADAENAGIPNEEWSRLVAARLLHIEHRGGVQWLEYSHDVLISIAQESLEKRKTLEELQKFDERMETHRRRNFRIKIYSIISAVLAIIFACVALWAIKAQRDAEKYSKKAELMRQKSESNYRLAVAYGKKLTERNIQLESIQRINESLSKTHSVYTAPKHHFFSEFNQANETNLMNIQNSALGYVRKFVDDNGRTALTGPEITRMMLKAMVHDLALLVNKKMDLRIRTSQASIFIGCQKAAYYQSLAKNDLIAEEKTDIENRLKILEAKEKLITSYEEQLDKEIARLRWNMKEAERREQESERILWDVESVGDFDARMEELFVNKNFDKLNDMIKEKNHKKDTIKVSNALWMMINRMPINNQMKVFYSEIVADKKHIEALWNKGHLLDLAKWELRVAELYEEIKNYEMAAIFIDRAVSTIIKHDFYKQEGFRAEIPLIGAIYKDIEPSLLKQFFDSSKIDEKQIAKHILCLHDAIFVQRILSLSALSLEKPYFSWYVYAKKNDLKESCDFHGQLCEFISKYNGMEATKSIRDIISQIKIHIETLPTNHQGKRADNNEQLYAKIVYKDNGESWMIWRQILAGIKENRRAEVKYLIEFLRKRNLSNFPQKVLDVAEALQLSFKKLKFSKGLVVYAYESSCNHHDILQIGDVIVAIDGKPCEKYEDFYSKVGSVYTIYRLNRNAEAGFDEIVATMPKGQPQVFCLSLFE